MDKVEWRRNGLRQYVITCSLTYTISTFRRVKPMAGHVNHPPAGTLSQLLLPGTGSWVINYWACWFFRVLVSCPPNSGKTLSNDFQHTVTCVLLFHRCERSLCDTILFVCHFFDNENTRFTEKKTGKSSGNARIPIRGYVTSENDVTQSAFKIPLEPGLRLVRFHDNSNRRKARRIRTWALKMTWDGKAESVWNYRLSTTEQTAKRNAETSHVSSFQRQMKVGWRLSERLLMCPRCGTTFSRRNFKLRRRGNVENFDRGGRNQITIITKTTVIIIIIISILTCPA